MSPHCFVLSGTDNSLGVGVQAVIARSFAFIYGRNQPSLGLLGVTISDDAFFQAATEGEDITLDIPSRTATVAGHAYPFALSDMEYNLTVNNGMTDSYKKFGKGIWESFTQSKSKRSPISSVLQSGEGDKKQTKMDW